VTKGFCGGKIVVDYVIKPVLYTYLYMKCWIKLMMVWLADPATVMLPVGVGAGFWNLGVWTHSLSGMNFCFPSAALMRLFVACSVYLFILFALGKAFVCPRPVHAWGSVGEGVSIGFSGTENTQRIICPLSKANAFLGQGSPLLMGCCQVVHAQHLNFNC